ncbi:MAG: SRPBCC family protein [Parasphingorhabdus sp.]
MVEDDMKQSAKLGHHDAAFLHSGNGSRNILKNNVGKIMVASFAVVAGGTYYALRHKHNGSFKDDAPRKASRRNSGKYDITGRTVTINRPREEIYAFWRDFRNLPSVMDNVEKVQPTGANGRAIWTIKAPAGTTVDVETEIVDDIANELISWRSVTGSQIETEGSIAFRDAPNGAGTWVEATIAYDPPAGQLGRMVAKAFRKEPGIEARHDLKRLKMLMETGEISTGRRRNDDEED